MLKTTASSDLAPKKLGTNEVIKGDNKVDDKNSSKMLKNRKSRIQTSIGAMREFTFLISHTKKAFNQWKQAFIKAPILQHFDPEYYIRIEIDASSYAIKKVLSQLTSNHLNSY